MKSHSRSNFSDDEDDPPLKLIKLSKDYDPLLKFSQEKCEFCEKLCFCRYDLLVHNAKHIIIPLKDELVQCKECSRHFASAMDLNIHTKIHHFKVPDILKSLVITKPVVECDNSLTDLVIQSNERKLEKIIHKKAIVECDSTVTELIAEKNIEKLKCFIIKQPIIRCEDTLKGILIKDCNSQTEKIKENLLNLPKEIIRKIESEKLKTDLLNVPKVVLKSNNHSPNNVEDKKKIESEKLKTDLLNVPKVVLKSKTYSPNNVQEIKKIESEKLKTDLLNVPKVVLKSNNYSPNNVQEIKKIESEKLKTDLLNAPKVVLKSNNYSPNNVEEIKKIESEKLKTDLLNVPKVVLKIKNYSPNNVADVKPQDPVTNLKNKEVMSQENNIVENKTNGVSSIKSRLRFEDDDDSDIEDDIINTNINGMIGNSKPTNDDICDLTLDDSDEDVKPPQFTALQCSLLAPNKSTDFKLINTPLATLTRLNQRPDVTTITREMEKFAPSVHYEELTEPSVWECRRCHSSFLNRYDLIMHETKLHLQIKRGIVHQKVRVCYACERYIIGNHFTVRKHMEEKHPFYEDNNKNKTLKKCTQCNLKYFRYMKHCNNYHLIYKCKKCYKAFEQENLLAEHVLVCRGIFEPQRNQTEQNPFKPELGVADRIGMEKIIKVCELCCLFIKNTQNYKYVLLRDYSEQGKRVACERCEKQFFEVKLIKLINRHPTVQPRYEYHKRAAPASTNEQRLKKIQQRLKLMNKLR